MNQVYDKAMAQQQQTCGQALGLGAPYPRDGATPTEVIEYLTVQLGAAISERNALRGRVRQLEQVNNSQWLQRQDASDTIVGLRAEVKDLVDQLKERAPEKQFVVIGCFGANARVERPMEMLSCASANGQTKIRVDARVKRRKRAGSSNSTP